MANCIGQPNAGEPVVIEQRIDHDGESFRRDWASILTHTHTYSGRPDHGGTCLPPASYEAIVHWARRCGIDAIGMGSPYTPKSACTYHRYDGEERGRYYRPDFDKLAVRDGDEIEAMLANLRRLASDDGCFFYLDNETPKGRYGHMWWVGYHYDFPPWHDYDQPFDRWMVEETQAGDHEDEPMPYERRPYLQILAAQRARGAMGIWAHPTSWWFGRAGQFITNLATEMPAHAVAEGSLDGMVIMGYHPFRPQYQALWFELLDRGYRVPGVAEMDCGLSDPKTWSYERPMMTFVHSPDRVHSTQCLVRAFRSGCIFAGTGPYVDLLVDGRRMGEVAETSPAHVHNVTLHAYPRRGAPGVARIELLGRGGRVLWSQDRFPGGAVHLRLPGLKDRGYLVARVFGEPPSNGWRTVNELAVSNPVYLHPRQQRFNPPASTRLTLTIDSDSPFAGGEVRFEAVDGQLLGSASAAPREITEILPANGRVTIVSTDGRTRTEYLVNANSAVQSVQRYLYRGRFLLDYPNLRPGELPPECWRLDRYVRAMREVTLIY
jgi:hypothetical protein